MDFKSVMKFVIKTYDKSLLKQMENKV